VPAGVVQVNSGANNAPGSGTQTASLSGAATANNQIVLVVGADDYAASPPSGFTQHTGCAQQTFLGHYLWRKTATGGETSISYTIGSASPSCWIVMECSGLDSASPYDTSNGQFAQSSATNYDTPTITPTSGDRLLVATIGGSLNSAFGTGMGAWTNSFAEQGDVWTTLGSGTRDSIGLAILAVTANGSTGYTTNATWDGGMSPQSRTGVIMALKVAGAASAASSPPRTINRFRRHLLVR
jgi:hypothetical protein